MSDLNINWLVIRLIIFDIILGTIFFFIANKTIETDLEAVTIQKQLKTYALWLLISFGTAFALSNKREDVNYTELIIYSIVTIFASFNGIYSRIHRHNKMTIEERKNEINKRKNNNNNGGYARDIDQ